MNRRAGMRSLVAFGLALALLLGAVALASSGGVDGEAPGGSRESVLSPGIAAYFYAAFLVAGAVLAPLFFYAYARERGGSRSQWRRMRMLPFALVAFAGVALLLVAREPDLAAQLAAWLGQHDDGGFRDEGRHRAQPPAVEWVPVALVSSAVATVGCAVGGCHVLRRRSSRRDAALVDALAASVDETLDDLRAEPDARRAIIRAYARLEATLERVGVAREHADAPFEYLDRVLLELDVAPEPVHALTELFEQAKFSDHPIDHSMKGEAIAALAAVRADLRRLA